MSAHLSYEIARARQQENAASTRRAHHAGESVGSVGPRRAVVRRAAQTVGTLGVCTAVALGVGAGGAHAHPVSPKPGARVSAQQLARELGAFEANGYAMVACTKDGTLLRFGRTGRSVKVKW